MTAARAEWRDGWRVVAGAALGLGTGQSLYNYVASLFVLPLSAEFGWSRGQIAGATATGLIGVVAAPFLGRLADRIGVRPVIMASMASLVMAYAALTLMPGSLVFFYVAIACLGLAGLGTTGITFSRAISSWFSMSRGLALGVSLAGVSIFAGVMPPVLNQVIATSGWRTGYAMLGVLALIVGLPAAWRFVHEKDAAVVPGGQAPAPLALRRALATPAFWLLLVAMIVINIPGNGMLNQLQPLLTDRGLTSGTAAAMLSIYAGAILVGRLLLGYMLDRASAPIVSAVAVSAPAIGAVMLIGTHVELWQAAVAVLLLGLSQGVEMDLAGFFIARFFGLSLFSTLFAFVISGLVLANVGGAILFGSAFDATGSYDKALAIGTSGFLIGGLCLLGLRWCTPLEHLD